MVWGKVNSDEKKQDSSLKLYAIQKPLGFLEFLLKITDITAIVLRHPLLCKENFPFMDPEGVE